MKLLLDTHIWLWSLLNPKRLPKRVAKELASGKHEHWLSPVSVLETVLLLERGRLMPDIDRWRWLDQAIAAAPFREASYTYDVAKRVSSVSLSHRDPTDRILVATALVHGLTLVTADERLLSAQKCPMLLER